MDFVRKPWICIRLFMCSTFLLETGVCFMNCATFLLKS
jgi:hypothetical protein